MRIAANGDWYHQGSLIQRKRLVKLFSTILKKELNDFFLVTPVEKYQIQVDDAPFVAVEVDRINCDRQTLVFRTNVDEQIIADVDHPINVKVDVETGEPRPYLHVRDGLNALLHRNVFYQLVEWSLEEPHLNGSVLVIESSGQKFQLGQL